MKYRKAESVLPQELLKQIQQYIQGEYVYIPNKNMFIFLIKRG
ncbi:MAG: hypothetical protein ACLTBU_11525 [Zhenhengia sp.]